MNSLLKSLSDTDPKVRALIESEKERIENTLDLIAAENHLPLSIMEVLGSIFNTKTIEGYPGNRYHAGCIYADEIETLAIERVKELFGAEYANVQPHSGTTANLAVYSSVLEIGDRILAMRLTQGGHLSHGHRASITSRCFSFDHYGVNPETECIDYDEVYSIAKEVRPRMLVAGASAYPKLIDYEQLSRIAQEISAYFMVDMAHIAGLVSAKVIPSPVPYADFVTFTCYKTMMGGRGGVILARNKFGKRIDKAIFPGCQGTSPVSMIAAKAVCFNLAKSEDFIEIQRRTVENARAIAKELSDRGYRIVAGGTDNHQVIVDVKAKGVSGDVAEEILESCGLIANRNAIPSDEGKPGSISGIRLGSAAITVRGMKSREAIIIAELIDKALSDYKNINTVAKVKRQINELAFDFPVYNL